MSREIRFRLRKKDTGKLACAYQADLILVPDTGQIYNGSSNVTDRYLMEQFTGLTDKNGVEIYEGDVVEYETNHYGNHKTGLYQVAAWVDDLDHDGFGQPFATGYILHGTNWKVIGNIYQNPELLEA